MVISEYLLLDRELISRKEFRGSVYSLPSYTGKRLTAHLPKLKPDNTPPLGTAGYSGLDRIYGSTRHQLAVPQYFWGPRESILSD